MGQIRIKKCNFDGGETLKILENDGNQIYFHFAAPLRDPSDPLLQTEKDTVM